MRYLILLLALTGCDQRPECHDKGEFLSIDRCLNNPECTVTHRQLAYHARITRECPL